MRKKKAQKKIQEQLGKSEIRALDTPLTELGVSWLMEVLLDQQRTTRDPHSEYDYTIFQSTVDDNIFDAFGLRHTESWTDLVHRAQRNKLVWIGHNILHDLCFLHTTFIGELPKTIGLFNERIHQLFPRMLDTKVMTATMTDADAVDETLESLFTLFKLQDYPYTRTSIGWGYNVRQQSSQQAAHEAGFDSKQPPEVAPEIRVGADTSRLHDSNGVSEECLPTIGAPRRNDQEEYGVFLNTPYSS